MGQSLTVNLNHEHAYMYSFMLLNNSRLFMRALLD